MRFKDKVVAVTGAGQGLGAQFSKDFAKEGAKVALIGRTKSKLDMISEEIKSAGGVCSVFVCDVGESEEVFPCFEQIAKELGNVNILVNNAAYQNSIPVVDTPVSEWEAQIKINLNGTFYCTKAVLPSMLERKYGKIINISSSSAKHFFPGFGAYAASKGGIISFTQTLSEEVKYSGINVNSIYLGMTNTDNTRRRLGNDKAVTVGLDEMLQVEDVSSVVTFLASDEASGIMGAAIDVFGKKS